MSGVRRAQARPSAHPRPPLCEGPRPPARRVDTRKMCPGPCLGCSAFLPAEKTDGHFFSSRLQAPIPLLTELKTPRSHHHVLCPPPSSTRSCPSPHAEETGPAPPGHTHRFPGHRRAGTVCGHPNPAPRPAPGAPAPGAPRPTAAPGRSRKERGLAGSKLHAPPHRSGSRGSRSPREGEERW